MTSHRENDFTVAFLKDQLAFLTDKIRKSTSELEEKEKLIQQIDHEKREVSRKFETLEFANFEL
jgi:prefoldin subunit 5